MYYFPTALLLVLAGVACSEAPKPTELVLAELPVTPTPTAPDSVKTIHIFVALCDNKYQGIVPVPAAIGNGQKPAQNLYWGAGYGILSFFKRSAEWQMIRHEKTMGSEQGDSVILEKVLFKHRQRPIYLLAEAYDGRAIKQCITNMLLASTGEWQRTEKLSDGRQLHFGSGSNLIAYVGHNGLMDFELPVKAPRTTNPSKDLIILACYSKAYFTPHIRGSGVRPVLWSTHLMAPEAYVVHDALKEWCQGKPADAIRASAARAYSKYQRCSESAARKLLVSGY